MVSFVRKADVEKAVKTSPHNFPSDALEDDSHYCSDNHNSSQLNGLAQGFTRSSNSVPTKIGTNPPLLVQSLHPRELTGLLDPTLPEHGLAHEGFLNEVKKIMQYSVNTWDPGFMSKLYASTDAPGLAAELILASLNTNVHTYQVSPALTIIEKYTTRALANLFGFTGPNCGGISVQGGSASNATSVVVARNTLYPETKQHGNNANGLKLLILTSAHGHYSIEKAAAMLGFGSSSVWSVPVDSQGCMDHSVLPTIISKAKGDGYAPFYLNATAGTTVLGSYDPIRALAKVCKEHNIWLHIDASWGGPAIFSPTHKHKLEGSHFANSIAINPHKMMGVPVTCSFLLTPDIRQFHVSNTLPANYLFHSSDDSTEVYDLADLTLQCGRRGDSLKLYLSWVYHGTDGYRKQIDAAFNTAAYLADLVDQHPDLVLVSQNPPPCCQVCFYYAKGGVLSEDSNFNSKITREIVQGLNPRGFMIDYAEGDERGSFLRPVVSRGTRKDIVEALVEAVVGLGEMALKQDGERS